MLPPYIINEIRRREHRRRDIQPQPTIELELPLLPLPSHVPAAPQQDTDRGVVIIELL